MDSTGDIGVLYSKVNKLDERMTKIESTRPYLENLVERSIQSHEKLAEAMQDMKIAMTSMHDKIDNQAHTLAEFKQEMEDAGRRTEEKFDKTEGQMAEVSKRISQVEEKGKFDIWGALKQYFPWIIALLGFGMLTASQFVKF